MNLFELSLLIYKISLGIVMLSILLAFLRTVKGPTLSDRVVALDLTVNIFISFIAIYSLIENEPIYMDVVIALALIIFLSTVAFAQFIERQIRGC